MQKPSLICEKGYIWNPVTSSCQNGKYLASIMDDSVITRNEILDAEAKSNDEERNSQQILIKKLQLKKHKIYILYLPFY